jgi:SAM-dependent methyltransferase
VKILIEDVDWSLRAEKGFLRSGIDPADRRGLKNQYIDLLQKMALEEAMALKGSEVVLDFGCGSGRIAYWIAPKVKRVVGLEVTREMIDLAEKNRTAKNIQFMVYDGIHFPVVPYPFDIILSVWVLQYMEGEKLKKTVSELAQYLKKGGNACLIEQASDNPRVRRPKVEEYLRAFKESKLECLRYYPIRNGRWWVLYLIRYGVIPRGLFSAIAKREILLRQKEVKTIAYYQDYLFVLRKS